MNRTFRKSTMYDEVPKVQYLKLNWNVDTRNCVLLQSKTDQLR